MLDTTLTRPSTRPTGASPRLVATAARLADAVTEFDAALDAGSPMFVLVRLDQEVAAADRAHRRALAATRSG